jgi:hypothetical protein
MCGVTMMLPSVRSGSSSGIGSGSVTSSAAYAISPSRRERFARDFRKPINLRLENYYSFNPKRRRKLGRR